MKTQLMDTANIPNNMSFKNLLEMPTEDPESVLDELRQLELEVERKTIKSDINMEAGLVFNVDAPQVKFDDTTTENEQIVEPDSTTATASDKKSFDTANIIRENNEESIKLDNKMSQMMNEIKTIKIDIENVDSESNKLAENKPLVFKETNKSELESLISTNLKVSTSNNSIASTLTNLSQSIKHTQSPEEELADWMCMGAHVIVSTNSIQNKPGYIRFIGKTKFAHGMWIGVELEQEFGKNDGSLKGVRYFRCNENYGTFVRADKLSLVKN